MAVFADPRVKRHAAIPDEGYDVERDGDVWAVVWADDGRGWIAFPYRDVSFYLGPCSTAEQAIKAVLGQ